MNLTKISKIINKFEGNGTFAYDTPLVLYRITSIVGSFDWSRISTHYGTNRLLFKQNGLVYVIPVVESKDQPPGTVGVDYDIVKGKYWLYMKPSGTLTYDILSVSDINTITVLPLVSGGRV